MGKVKVLFLIIVLTGIYGMAQENGLSSGIYTTQMHGATKSFNLKTDNTFETFVNGTSVVTGNYTIDADTLTAIDIAGQIACAPENNKGIYTWTCKNDSIILKAVKDDCQGRAKAMTQGKWIKKTD